MVRLEIVGGGRMGEALIGGLLAAGWAAPSELAVVERSPARREALAKLFPDLLVSDEPRPADGAIVAVKPGDVAAACQGLAAAGVPRLLSIAAGITIDALEAAAGAGVRVVRAMPNTPALVGAGASAIAWGTTATDDDLDWAESILASVGIVVRVTEPQLDAVTGLSGSGPAYVFLVAESLIDAGVLVGLPRDVASRLAHQTLLGAARLLTETDDDAAALRAAVTSPGGTTAAGLRALEDRATRAAFIAAVDAATARARELGVALMALRYDTITFLTDYGLTDEFVGVVRSVIRTISPEVAVVDLTHDIAPYDVRGGGLALARSAPYLCPGVVLAIVDPGVGTDRRAIAVEVGDGASVLVGPDNGLLAPAVAMCGGVTRAVELTNPDYQLDAGGLTFAGRDIFAPAAAYLSNGIPLTELGTPIDPVTLRPGLLPVPHEHEGEVHAEVLWVDRYGNAQLNLDPSDIAAFGDRVRLRFNDETRTATVITTFADADPARGKLGPNDIGLMVDSYGLLAIVVDQQSAAVQLGIGASTPVYVSGFADDQEGPSGVTTFVELRPRSEE